jgi:hypothetical protein
MEVSGQLHDPAALPPRKQHPLPIEYGAGRTPRKVLKAAEKRKM